MTSKPRLFNKYIVTKADGSPTDSNAIYFVLRLDTDEHARKALKAYADSLMKEAPMINGKFAIQLLNLLRDVS